MTPEEKLYYAAMKYMGPGNSEYLAETLREAALAYARPIVAEECAKIIERIEIHTGYYDAAELEPFVKDVAVAIRAHGKVNP